MIFDTAAVLSVADEGGLPAGKLDTDLMRPSGLRINEEFCDGDTVEFEGTGGFVGENSLFGTLAGMFCIDDIGFVVIPVEEEHITEFAGRRKFGVSRHERGISFMETSVGDDFRQFGGGLFRPCADHKTGGRPVEAMDGINLIGVRFAPLTESIGDGVRALAFGEHPAGFIHHDEVAGEVEDIDHFFKNTPLDKVYLII